MTLLTNHDLLKQIAADYSLQYEELATKYLANTNPVKSKRGRKRKHPVTDDFVEMEEYEYDGSMYLIDVKKNIYSYDLEEPIMIGTLLVDGSIKFL